ncbi:MAG: sulfite exporter TauE/SafE family protein [Candidatus Puniceispirillaceae bacterium]
MEEIWSLYFPLLATGLVSGFMAGLLGVGGGLVIVPVLATLLELQQTADMQRAIIYPMHMAIGTSLAIIVPTSILSARTHFKLGNVDKIAASQLALPIFIGAFGGAVLVKMMDNATLKILFGSLAIFLSISFWTKVMIWRHGLPAQPVRSGIGGLIGLISAVVGIGGGSLTVPTLSACGWAIHRAVGTSALLGLVISVPAMLSYIFIGWGLDGRPDGALGFVWLPAALTISLTALVTAPIGAKTAAKIDKEKLRKIFGIFMVLVGGRLIYDGVRMGGFAVLG